MNQNLAKGRAAGGSAKGGAERRGGRFNSDRGDKEFDQTIIDLARVTRVTKGGKRMRFRACVVIGDRKGRVGFGLAKGADVTAAVNKAVRQAKKGLVTVRLVNETIPLKVKEKYGAAVLLLKPAPKGSGIIAGGAAREVLALAGVPNVVGKNLGGKNKINNVKVVFKAFARLNRYNPVRRPI